MEEQDLKTLNNLFDNLEDIYKGLLKGTIKDDHETRQTILRIEKEVKAIEEKYSFRNPSRKMYALLREIKEYIRDIKNDICDPTIIDSVMQDMFPNGNIDMED